MVRRLVALVVVCVTSVFGLASVAGADLPLYPLQFSGASAHGRYQVLVETGCYSEGGQACGGSPTPNYLYVEVTTPAHPGGMCPGNEEFQFTNGSIKASGAFNVQQAYAGGLTVSVHGSFPSTRSVHGTITMSHSCPSDYFTFTLPRPLVKVPPPGHNVCYWLVKSGAGRLLGSPPPLDDTPVTGISPVTGLGQCEYYVHTSSFVNFSISQQDGIPPVGSQGVKAVSGLGPGAGEFGHAIAATRESRSEVIADVSFHLGSAWLSIDDEAYGTGSALKVAKLEARLADAARLIYHLIA